MKSTSVTFVNARDVIHGCDLRESRRSCSCPSAKGAQTGASLKPYARSSARRSTAWMAGRSRPDRPHSIHSYELFLWLISQVSLMRSNILLAIICLPASL